MIGIEERGRARLKLRLPDWRRRFELVSSQSFLDICEAYELAWMGLDHWTRSDEPTSSAIVADYLALVASLELDAKYLAARDGKEQP
jgi:hypothetical protein